MKLCYLLSLHRLTGLQDSRHRLLLWYYGYFGVSYIYMSLGCYNQIKDCFVGTTCYYWLNSLNISDKWSYRWKRKQTAVTSITNRFRAAVCFLFLLKLKWPKNDHFYNPTGIRFRQFLTLWSWWVAGILYWLSPWINKRWSVEINAKSYR